MLQFIYFRRAGRDDLPAVQTLLEEERLPTDGIAPEEFIVAVHERENRILGCGQVREENDGFELADLVIQRDHRSEGIGRFLAQRILEGRRRPVYAVTFREYAPFFEKLGFRLAGADEAPAWLRGKRDQLQRILPDAQLVYAVRDASVVSF